MHRAAPIALLCTAAAAIIAYLPASAGALPPIGERHNGLSVGDETYLHVWLSCWRADGCDPGRNIVAHKLASGKPASDSRITASRERMQGWLSPSPTASTATSTPTVSASSSGTCTGITPYPGGGQCWAIPYSIVLCESGGQDIPNAEGSSAAGYYQILGESLAASKAQQDADAAAIWDGGAGAGAWVCAG